MKKTTKLFAGLALAAMMLSACSNPYASSNNNPDSNNNGNFRQQDIYHLYKAAGGSMTYEEWLDTVRGADGATFLAGTTDPDNSQGKSGDVYVNTESWDAFLKVGDNWSKLGNLKGDQGPQGEQGPKGDQGDVGPQGPKGDQGDVGPQGPKGDQGDKGDQGEKGDKGDQGEKGDKGDKGDNGLDGAPGASVLNGYGAPSDDKGNDGDCYIDYSNFDFYSKNNGHWFRVNNLAEALNWDIDVQAEMLKYVGEVLPFVEFNADTFYHNYSSYYEDYGIGMYILGDDNPYDVFFDYGDRLLAAGFEYAPGTSSYYGLGDYVKVLDDGTEIAVEFKYYEATSTYEAGNQITVYIPVYVEPYTEEYWLENGFEKVSGWPADVIELAFDEPNRFGPINDNGDWFKRIDTKPGSGSNAGKFRTTGYLTTAGDFTEALIADLLESGFIYSDYYGDYEFPDDENVYINTAFQGGYTIIYMVGPWVERDIEIELPGVDGINDIIVGYFGEQGTEVTCPEYTSSNADAYYEQASTTAWRVYGSGTDDMDAFAAAMASGGWKITYPWSSYPHDFKAYFGSKPACVTVESYSSYVKISVSKDSAPAEGGLEDINDLVVAYYASQDLAVTCPEYTSSNAEAYYEASGTTALKVMGSNTADMAAFAAALANSGWSIEHPWASYPDDFKAYFGDTNACLKVEDYNSYVKISFTKEYAPVKLSLADVNDLIVAYYAALDIEVSAPEYTSANADAYYETSGTSAINIRGGSNVADMKVYEAALQASNWTIEHFSSYYPDDFKAYFGDNGANTPCLKIEDYTSYVKISFTQAQPPVPPTQYSAAEVSAAYVSFFKDNFNVDVEMADYPFASENGYFNLMDSFLANGILVYDAYNSNETEMMSFIGSLETLGWTSTYDTANDLYYIEYGDTGAVIEVFTQQNGTIRIGGLFVPPPVADFPAAQVNAFLAQYELGFTLSDELVATLPGESFSFNSGSASGYAYCYVDIPGNFAAEYEAAIAPLLTAAGYTKKTDSSGSEYYANSVDHQVSFKYYADGNYTEVLFFE